jgi:type VI protein secretion system component Hcp
VALNFYLSLSGITSATHQIEVNTLNFGGDDPNGTLTPSDVIVSGDASRFSPDLLRAFAEQTPHKAVIKGYEPNVAGVQTNFVTITLINARVVSYHLGGTPNGRVVDTLHLNFATLEYDFPTLNADYIWQVA